MELVDVGPGTATMQLELTDDMVNGHDIGHGGITFTLADSAFAFACNSHNRVTVAASAEIGSAGRRSSGTCWSPPQSSVTGTGETGSAT